MPIYAYQCEKCKAKFDLYFPLKEWDVKPACPDCGGQGKKIFTSHIQRDEPVWLNDEVKNGLQDREDPAHRPIETRCDYNRFLKDNGITER